MPKPHTSLSPRTNILLIFVWAVVAAAFFFVIEPHAPITLGVIGALLGAIGGIMQHLRLRDASGSFVTTSSLLEVRSALKGTTWGRRYIRFLWSCKLLLLILAFVLIRESLFAVLFGYLAAYSSLMFVREIVTLRDTFFLHRLSSNESNVA